MNYNNNILMHRQLQQILHKPMSRREFLVTIGFGLATLVGLAGLLQLLGKRNPWQAQSSGYGASSYGGNSKVEG